MAKKKSVSAKKSKFPAKARRPRTKEKVQKPRAQSMPEVPGTRGARGRKSKRPGASQPSVSPKVLKTTAKATTRRSAKPPPQEPAEPARSNRGGPLTMLSAQIAPVHPKRREI